MARSAIKAGDGAPQHFDGDKFLYFSGNLAKRNALRSICIEERNDEGFSPGKGVIYVYPDFN